MFMIGVNQLATRELNELDFGPDAVCPDQLDGGVNKAASNNHPLFHQLPFIWC